jgi:hypothetical protein
VTDDQPAAPPPVPGDTKDWTWVLERACPDCRFDGRDYPCETCGTAVRGIGQEWQEILGADPESLRHRSRPDRWSTVEYGCHVRDVFRIFADRVELMLTTDGAASPTGIRTPPPSPTATTSS